MIIILGYLIFVDTERQRILAKYDNNIYIYIYCRMALTAV